MSARDPKQVILDAALATFAEFGFDRTTTGHILARAGVSNGALFHHFPSKEAIAEALYLRGIASYQDGLIKALDGHRTPKTARRAVKAAVHHHLTWVESNRDLARFMYERGRPDWQPVHGSAVRKLNRAAARHVHDWMTPLIESGVIRDLPLTVLIAFINGPAHFVVRRWFSGLITARPTSFSDDLADAAWAAIARHKPKTSFMAPPLSPAALIESVALDAARSTHGTAAPGDWAVISLAMTNATRLPPVTAESARVQSVQMAGDGRIADVDVVLVDADGNQTTRGHVVCMWQEPFLPGLATKERSRSEHVE